MLTSLIFGGTRGIGSVVSEHLKKRGDNVITISRRSSEAEGHISLDLEDNEFIEQLLSRVPSQIDNVIFLQRYRGDDPKKDHEIMVEATMKVVEGLAPLASSNACFILVGSNANRFILPEQSATYHSSRMGLENLTRYYAVKYGPRGIRFNCVLPTTVLKPENKDFFLGEEGKSVREMIEKITPLGRMGDSQDIANLIEFLGSQKASFITGQTFLLDGGTSLLSHESVIRGALENKNPNSF